MTASTSATPDITGPSDPTAETEHEVLRELRRFEPQLKLWRNVHTGEGKARRAALRAEIRPILDRGIASGVTREAMGDALDIGTAHVDNIRHNNPTGRPARAGKGATLSPELRNTLSDLGSDLKAWRYAKGEEAEAERARLRTIIHNTVHEHPEAIIADIAFGLGISPQALYNILKDNTTGRPQPRHHAQLDPQLRDRLRELGEEWNPVDRTGLFTMRDAIYGSVLSAVTAARNAGLTLNDISGVSGLSYGQLTAILREDPTGRNRG